jgi:hypothetical protein
VRELSRLFARSMHRADMRLIHEVHLLQHWICCQCDSP